MTWNMAKYRANTYRRYKPVKPVVGKPELDSGALKVKVCEVAGSYMLDHVAQLCCGYIACQCGGTGMRVDKKACGCLSVTYKELLRRYSGDDGATPPRHEPGILFCDGTRVWAAMSNAPVFVCYCEPCRMLDNAKRMPGSAAAKDIRPCSTCNNSVFVAEGDRHKRRHYCDECNRDRQLATLPQPARAVDHVRASREFQERTGKELLALMREQAAAEKLQRAIAKNMQAAKRDYDRIMDQGDKPLESWKNFKAKYEPLK